MERISRLMDGELDAQDAHEQLNRLKVRDELRENWDMFHLIGDTLRGEPLLSPGFSERIAERIAREPTVLAPRRFSTQNVRAYALSAAASLAAIALVGWLALSMQTVIAPPPLVAQAPVPMDVPAAPAPKVQLASEPNDGTHNEYLLAHTGFSPTTAIQGIAPYIRSVASSRPAQDR